VTFSKNRHGRFQESKLFEQLFEQIVRQCVEVGLVQGKHLSVDGSFVEANATPGCFSYLESVNFPMKEIKTYHKVALDQNTKSPPYRPL
jgi:hypothetical protein